MDRHKRISLGVLLSCALFSASVYADGNDAGRDTVLKTADGQPCMPVDGKVPVVAAPKRKKRAAAAPVAAPPPVCTVAPIVGPSNEDLQRRLDEQQKQLDELRAAAAVPPPPPPPPLVSKMHFSSFGEAYYANLDESPGADIETIDYRRVAVGFAYDFKPTIRFIGMMELEHAATDDDNDAAPGDPNNGDGSGDLHLESAYVEFDLTPDQRLIAGLFPIPIGILNQRHLPTDYYGVERPVVETEILPTTWSETGAMLSGLFGGRAFAYDFAVHGGMLTPGAGEPNAYRTRNGLQRSSTADASGLASTARLKFIGVQGLELAAAVHYEEDLRQNLDPEAVEAWLYEAHAIAEYGAFTGRALWTQWNLDGSGPDSRNRDVQDGWYVEGGWRFLPKLGAFVQYSDWNPGNNADNAGEERWMIGMSYWPIPQIVFKADYKWQDGDDGARNDGFRLGLGFAFF